MATGAGTRDTPSRCRCARSRLSEAFGKRLALIGPRAGPPANGKARIFDAGPIYVHAKVS